MFSRRILSLFLCFALLPFSFTSCKNNATQNEKNEPTTQAKSYYEYFDTVSVIFSYKGDSAEEFNANHTAVAELLDEYHKLFDIYYEYAGISNLKTVNKKAGIEPVRVDEKLIDFLIYAKEIYTLTNGKTNVAMGAVLKLWHDKREAAVKSPENAQIPTKEELDAAKDHCDIEKLVIDKEAGTVYLSDPQMRLDVGALGKGYATEKAAEMLIAKGVTSYVLNIGGNIRAIGEKVSGEGWSTGITNPDKSSDKQFAAKVMIKDVSLVTSGDYERYFTANGKKYHHVIDPVTLMPAEYFSSVSIFTKDSGLADALSTALFCMSYEDGLALVESIGDVEVIWVDRDYNLKHTDGIELLPIE